MLSSSLCERCHQYPAHSDHWRINRTTGERHQEKLCHYCANDQPPPQKQGISDSDLLNIFRRHVPALANGEIEIRGIAREPGRFGIFAVAELNGESMRRTGSLMSRYFMDIASELGGEHFAFVLWDQRQVEFIRKAIGIARYPATFKEPEVTLDESALAANVTVDANTIAVLRSEGELRLRLISKLVGWRLNLVARAD